VGIRDLEPHHKLICYTFDVFEFAVLGVTGTVSRYYEAYAMVIPVRTAASADKSVGKLCGTLLGC
jgi:hypothetical protein